MSSRELVIRTLNHQPVSRIPRDLWPPISRGAAREDEIAEIGVRFPSDIIHVELHPLHGKKPAVKSAKGGENSDVLGLPLATRRRGHAGPRRAGPTGRTGQGRRVSAADRVARSLALRQGQQELPGHQPLRAGMVGGPAVRSAAVSPRQRGGPGRSRPRHEGRSAACWRCCTTSPARRSSFGRRRTSTAWSSATTWGSPDGLLIAPEMWRELFRPLLSRLLPDSARQGQVRLLPFRRQHRRHLRRPDQGGRSTPSIRSCT